MCRLVCFDNRKVVGLSLIEVEKAMGAKKPQYIKSIGIREIASNWPLGAVPFSIVRLFFLLTMNLNINHRATFLSDTYTLSNLLPIPM